MSEKQTSINLAAIADQTDVVLTQIFRDYIAKGSPTKLGGLRFLDVESSKTFAFERCRISEDGTGNLLVISAPYTGAEEDFRHIVDEGPYGKDVQVFIKRNSSDAGKEDKMFIEVGYYMPTAQWLSDDEIISFSQRHVVRSTRDAVIGILEEKVLPMASEIIEFLIQKLRIH